MASGADPAASRTTRAWDGARVLAIARAMLPPGRVLPGADERTLDRLDRFLAGMTPSAPAHFARFVDALDAAAVLSTGRRFSALFADAQERLLGRWARDPILSGPLRLAAAVIQWAHYDDADVHARLGARFSWSAQPEPERWLRQVTRGEEWKSGESIDCDVVVVGTGAGGAVVARELAERGLAVLLLEEGDLHRRDEFTGDAAQAYRKFYRQMGTVAALGNTAIPIFMGRIVGGSTAINTATCFRTPPWVLDRWCEELGTDELSPARMAPHFDRVEHELGVAPVPPEHFGAAGRMIARGCDALGWRHAPVRRNVDGCDGQGVCNFGCPTGAKRSMDRSYVPRALLAGAQLVTGMRADRVIVEGGRAVGVEAIASRGGARLVARARAVVLAGGAVPTPVLLLRQGIANRSGRVGRGLSLHPATSAAALFDEPIRGFASIPQAYSCDEFHKEGILMLGASAPIPATALMIQLLGRRKAEVMDEVDRVASFGVMIEDEVRGRVRPGPRGRPLVTYRLGRIELERLQRGVSHLAQIWFAAGARRVFPLMAKAPVLESAADLRRFRASSFAARDFLLTSFHPLGTCRLGTDPRTSVVGLDHESHDVPGLFVVDGSTVPGPPTVNPQLTIMAMATRAAGRIADRLS